MNWNIIILTYISFLNFAIFLFLSLTAIRLSLMYRITKDNPTLATLLLYVSLALSWLHSVVVSSPFYQAGVYPLILDQTSSVLDVSISYWYRGVSLTLLSMSIFYFDHVMRQGSNDY